MGRSKKKRVEQKTQVEEIGVMDFKTSEQVCREWIAELPYPSEGMPTQREYGEWLIKWKAWIEKGHKNCSLYF